MPMDVPYCVFMRTPVLVKKAARFPSGGLRDCRITAALSIWKSAMDTNNFQRIGSISNAHAGKEFEQAAQVFFARLGINLSSDFPVAVGFDRKKLRKFDLGSAEPAIIVECKSHNWTQGGNIPSAKLTVWNESMFYFHIAPAQYRKLFLVLRSVRGSQSLAEYYVRNHGHLIPPGVEMWECDATGKSGQLVYPL